MPPDESRRDGRIAAFIRLRIPRAQCLAVFLALAGLPAIASAQAPACEPESALDFSIGTITEDGSLFTGDNLRLRLAGIIWPDHLEPRAREQLVATLKSALADQHLSWKPAAAPDRWGVIPAHVFVREPGAAQPFWLQAGLVERGLVPVWPQALPHHCLVALEAHERQAIAGRRGYWAPRAQARRHLFAEQNREAHLGRRMAGLFRVASARAWRGLYFVNFTAANWPGPAVSLTQSVVAELGRQGVFPRDWRGGRVLVRFVHGPGGLRRLRAETIDHIRKLD